MAIQPDRAGEVPVGADVGSEPDRTGRLSDPVLMEDLGTTRNPNMMELDLRLAKDIKIGPAGFEVAMEGFNITNTRTVLQRNNRIYRSLGTLNAKGNAIEEVMSPRIFRLAAKLFF